MSEEVVVVVSGGFDPLHVGHVRMFNEAKKLGTDLVVILNNNHWVQKKKGYVFQPEQERAEIIESICSVDEVMITKHRKNDDNMTVCDALLEVITRAGGNKVIFANGGDRILDNVPEVQLCLDRGVEMRWNVGGGKVRSSSEMVEGWKNVR